ncbi:hypothetical protein L3Q82_007803 [Scortum barcoo]|uniref:Uncharacterized protein n=1 Tax=Scortum barcoo TaxID=214431 RepID=A0ACB8WK48_9TELE|nr:hypothetical protein L3Q82_007803 [Scortum barcoo]
MSHQGGSLGEDPGHAGETMSLGWPGNASGSPREELEEVSGVWGEGSLGISAQTAASATQIDNNGDFDFGFEIRVEEAEKEGEVPCPSWEPPAPCNLFIHTWVRVLGFPGHPKHPMPEPPQLTPLDA